MAYDAREQQNAGQPVGGLPWLQSSVPYIPQVITPGQQPQSPQVPGGLMKLAGNNPTGGILQNLNQWGATNLGFSPGLTTYNVAGGLPAGAGAGMPGTISAATPGSSGVFGGTTFSGALGGAALGAGVGGITAGLMGGNPTGGTIGGGLGGLGAAAMGFGPIGMGIAGILGGGLGGMFGSKEPPMKTSNFLMNINKKTGTYKFPTTYGTKGLDEGVARGVGDDFSNYIQQLSEATGVNFTGGKVFGGYNDKYDGGYYIRTQNTRADGSPENEINAKFDPNNPASKQEAYKRIAVGLLKDKTVAEKNKITPELLEKINNFIPADQQMAAQGMGMLGSMKPREPIVDVLPAQGPQANFEDFMKRHKAGESPSTNGPGAKLFS